MTDRPKIDDAAIEEFRRIASHVINSCRVDEVCDLAKQARAQKWTLAGFVAGAGAVSTETARQWAQLFHETYERLAPQFGYETRKDSAVPWSEVPEPNRKLMIAVCEIVLTEATAKRDTVLAACERRIRELEAELQVEQSKAIVFGKEVTLLRRELARYVCCPNGHLCYSTEGTVVCEACRLQAKYSELHQVALRKQARVAELEAEVEAFKSGGSLR